MSNIYIIYRSFFDLKGENFTVGGIQTYIRQLIRVIQKRNDNPIVVQFADLNFNKKFNNINVYGVDVHDKSKEEKKTEEVLKFVKKNFEEGDMVIFATEDIFVPSSIKRVMAIQHGVGWDIPKTERKSKLFLEVLRKSVGNYLRIKRISELENLVCVDYNFVNWYRSQVSSLRKNIYVIPNCTTINDFEAKRNLDVIKIIFARRFVTYRGTRLFSNAIKRILEKYDNVYITFAGEGPDESYLKDIFKNNPRVHFIKYDSENSFEIHKDYHIAVIPTIGSEGTSLSLLEAMSSKCAVIASNVGGMTNIILDNYNGLMINPVEKELYEAIEKLITNNELRERLSENAYHTVSAAFNSHLWEERWNKVLDEILD